MDGVLLMTQKAVETGIELALMTRKAVETGRAFLTNRRTAETGKAFLTTLIAMPLTAGVVGFWTLAAGLMLVIGATLACGTMASQTIRRLRNG
jgi:multisubunit Na+/H+ antiporter MnhC subunit